MTPEEQLNAYRLAAKQLFEALLATTHLDHTEDDDCPLCDLIADTVSSPNILEFMKLESTKLPRVLH